MKQGSFETLNQLGASSTPFVFFLDYKKEVLLYSTQNEWKKDDQLYFNFPGGKNDQELHVLNSFESVLCTAEPPSFDDYQKAFNKVQEALNFGDSYLLNLTFKSKIQSNLSLAEIYPLVQAKFKAFFLNKYLFFSPEIFIEIKGNTLFTYPMKGTINANLPNAHETLLFNQKEKAEHNTIVDLLRNDISMIGTGTQVKKYRFIDQIDTHKGSILQASSQISTELDHDWKGRIGDILNTLTPAGSICGAPKQRTCEIIDEIEDYDRGFYTGICGIFDGHDFNSGVMIRFIEEDQGQLYFKSGGGIHHLSNVEDEYQELIQKIYLPIVND